MPRLILRILILASVCGAFRASPANAQSALPPRPVPVSAEGQTPMEPVLVPAEGPRPFPGSTNHSPGSSYFTQDLPLDPGEGPPPGFFGAVEAGLVFPHIKNRLTNTVLLNNEFPETVHLPTAELDATVSPKFELGYRLPEGSGEFVASYRFLAAESTEHILFDDGFGDLKSRLNLNAIDLDYASREWSLGPRCDLRWLLGARLAQAYFDSRVNVFVFNRGEDGGFSEERTSNHFFGAGPHLGLELARKMETPGVSVIARIDGAVAVGRIHQGFEQVDHFAFFDRRTLGGATTVSKDQGVPMLGLQVGVAWTPPHYGFVTYSMGYQFERWWSVGRVDDSNAEITFQGVFVRAQFNY